jgi:hypothetical protein
MPNEYTARALGKLSAGLDEAKNAGRAEGVVAGPVCEALKTFCRQEPEFAQAVAQGKGTFADCCKHVAKNAGSALSDLEAFQRAVQFWFPSAVVQFQMRIDLCGANGAEGKAGPGPLAAPDVPAPPKAIIVSLDDLLDF